MRTGDMGNLSVHVRKPHLPSGIWWPVHKRESSNDAIIVAQVEKCWSQAHTASLVKKLIWELLKLPRGEVWMAGSCSLEAHPWGHCLCLFCLTASYTPRNDFCSCGRDALQELDILAVIESTLWNGESKVNPSFLHCLIQALGHSDELGI